MASRSTWLADCKRCTGRMSVAFANGPQLQAASCHRVLPYNTTIGCYLLHPHYHVNNTTLNNGAIVGS